MAYVNVEFIFGTYEYSEKKTLRLPITHRQRDFLCPKCRHRTIIGCHQVNGAKILDR